MHFINTILTILALFSIASSQTTDEVNLEDTVVQLKFTIREERIPGIINYLLNNSLEDHDITTQDIIQLSKLNRYSLEDIIQVLNYFNTSVERLFTVDKLERVLVDLDTEFSEFYRNLLTKLNVADDQTTQKILADLAIDQLKFLFAIVRDSYVYDILRGGSYDAEHVNAALATLGKSGNEVYIAARDILVEKALTLNSTAFINVIKDGGWNRHTSMDLWNALNLTTRDVYEVEKFRNIFTAISTSLNKNLTIAVFVGRNQLALHEQIYHQFDKNVDGITIKIEAKEVEVSPNRSRQLGVNIVELTAKSSRDKYIEITDNYNSTQNCFYVTFNNSRLITKSVEADASLTVQKTNGLVFNLGSPLICQGYLYGLAREENNNTIIFDEFYLTEEEIIAAEEEMEGEEDIVSGGVFNYPSIKLTLVLNLFMCFVLF